MQLAKAVISYIANYYGEREEITKVKKEFDKIDTNKDGFINEEELYACIFSHIIVGLIKIYPKIECEKKIKEIFDEVDFNKDGTISFSEFVAISIKNEQTLSKDVLKKAFLLFDLVYIRDLP